VNLRREATALLAITLAIACDPSRASDPRRLPDVEHPQRDAKPDDNDEGSDGGNGTTSVPGERASDAHAEPTPPAVDAGLGASPPDAGLLKPEGVECNGLFCDVFATCEGADEPTCECAPGLQGDGQRCEDVDECQQAEPVCSANSTCHNTFASYTCSCNVGYVREGDTCVVDSTCVNSPCDEAATCQEVDGNLRCDCDDGSFGNGFFCAPDDTCADAPCGAEGECVAVDDDTRGHVCLCPLGFAGDSQCMACGEELKLEDPALERAVRRQLGRSEEDERPILVADLAGNTTLNAARFGVTNLSGLECWPTLRSVDLSYNEELDTRGVSALGALNQLLDLRLDCTHVTDLQVLSGHTRLHSLSLNVLNCDEPTTIETDAPLASLGQLEVLDLRGQKLAGGSGLGKLHNLRTLWFGYNELRHVSELPDLPLLRELDVSFNQLEGLDTLGRFSRLQYLNVSNNQLTDLDVTTQLARLGFLNASDNRITELPDWQNQRDLRELNLSNNRISSVAGLQQLSQLRWVNIAANSVTNLSALVHGSLRGTLVIAGNPLACSEQASIIATLRSVGIDLQGGCVP
jgi:hypothetical protein